MRKIRANVPSRKKIKLEWFKSKCDFTIERNIAIEYNANSVTYNKINWDVNVKYLLTKEGDPKEIPSNSPMTLYKGGLPSLFLSTSATIGNKIISEELIDSDIIVDDDIVQISEGKPEITFEDALKPEEHIEVRTRYDKINRKINIENKLDNEIELNVFDGIDWKEYKGDKNTVQKLLDMGICVSDKPKRSSPSAVFKYPAGRVLDYIYGEIQQTPETLWGT